MNRFGKILLLLCCAAALTSFIGAEFRFPMPEFESGYQHPDMHVPPPNLSHPVLDIAVLTGVLALSAWFAIKKRSRAGMFSLAVFSVLYFGFWRRGCVCSVGALQNVAAALTDSSFQMPPVVLVFFLLPLASALFFGRIFCAAACPLGALQELAAIRPVQLPRPIEQVLRLTAYLYLGLTVLSVFMGAGFLICRYDPFIGFFRLGASFNLLLLGALFLVAGIFIARPYCRFLCPYGVLLGWMSRFSKWHVSIAPDACVQCRLCQEACPYGAILTPTPEQPPLPRRAGARRLGLLLLLSPVIVGLCAWTGMMSHEFLARLHPTVRLAERVAAEERGVYTEMTIESEAFRSGTVTLPQLFDDAAALRQRFRRGAWWFGAFFGLVIVVRWFGLSRYSTRKDYLADRTHCVSCARCFAYCPVPEKIPHAP